MAQQDFDPTSILREVYLNFIDSRDKYKRTFNAQEIARGVTSQVYRINKDIIGKLTELPETPITLAVDAVNYVSDNDIKINSKLYIWEHLQKIQQDRNLSSNIRKTLKHIIALPLYKEIYIDDESKKVFLVSFERYIPGNVMEQMIQTFGQDEKELTKFTFVLLDVLHFLGTKYKFNHNDFHFNNLMVVEADKYNMCTYKSISVYGEKTFTIENLKYIPVIIDFDFAIINYDGTLKEKIDAQEELGKLAGTLKEKIDAQTELGKLAGTLKEKIDPQEELDKLWMEYYKTKQDNSLKIHKTNAHESLSYSPSIDVAYYTTFLLHNISKATEGTNVLGHLIDNCSIGHLLDTVLKAKNDIMTNDIMTNGIMEKELEFYAKSKKEVYKDIISSFKKVKKET